MDTSSIVPKGLLGKRHKLLAESKHVLFKVVGHDVELMVHDLTETPLQDIGARVDELESTIERAGFVTDYDLDNSDFVTSTDIDQYINDHLADCNFVTAEDVPDPDYIVNTDDFGHYFDDHMSGYGVLTRDDIDPDYVISRDDIDVDDIYLQMRNLQDKCGKLERELDRIRSALVESHRATAGFDGPIE